MFPAAKYLIPQQDSKDSINEQGTSWLKSVSYETQPLEESTSIPEHKRRHEDISSNSDDDDLTSTSQKQSKKKEKKKHKKKHDKHHKSSKHDKPSTSKQHDSKPITIWIEETNLSAKDAFRCDNKPDWSNFSYDSLYSGDLANYRRRFGNYCLGIGDSNIKFTDQRNISTKKKSKLSSTQSRYYEDKVCDSAHVSILLKMEDSIEEIAMTEEFLPVETDTSRSIVDGEVSETPEVYLMKRAGEYNTRLLDKPHDVQLWMEFIDFQDEALIWGKLPSITASTAQLEGTNTTATNESIRRQKLALNERKIAIFERALEKNPLSEELLVGHMELVQEVWETERLVKKWKDIVFKQPNRSLLWLKYIEFCQSRFSFYRSSSVASLYQKAISTLTSIINRSLLSHKPEPDAKSKMVALFLLYCYFLKHSGFIEKAVALLQALVEFNLCSPEEFFESQSLHKIKDRLEVFETFWDGDGARIGEEGAMGWKGWFHHHAAAQGVEEHLLGVINEKEIELLTTNRNTIGDTPVDTSNEDEDKEVEIVKGQPINTGWAKLEMHREFTSCLPGKLSSEDDDNDGDLDHTILFDDISLCLFLVEDQQLKASLLMEFLRFLGAPICSPPLISVVYPDTVHMIVDPVEVLFPTSTIPLSFESVVPSIVYQPRPLVTDFTSIANGSFYNLLFTSSNGACLSSPLKVFTTRLFNHSSSLIQSLAVSPEIKSTLTCSWLQYELNNIHTDVGIGSSVAECLHKLSISLLKSVSLADYGFVWSFINQLEPLLSIKKKTSSLSKVFLHPFTLLPSPRGTSLFIFCQLFVECMLKIRQPINCYSKHLPSSDLALFTLVSLSQSEFNPTMLPVSGVKVPSAQLLKAREYFEELSSHVLRLHSNISQPEVTSKLGCCLYFKYLTEGIDSACELTQQFLNVLAVHNHHQYNGNIEGLYVMVVKLVEVHSRNNPIKPQIMRDILCSALSHFPHHFWFLRMFIQWEEQSFNTGQLRRFFTSLVHHKNSNGVIPALFAVSAEIGRYTRLNELVGVYMEEPSSGLLQRARSFFIRGSQTKIGSSSPALWRAYIKFEIEYGNTEKAKAVFYQAIQRCPWVKMIYFDGIQYFSDDGQKIMEILEEKELRVRSAMEEVQLLLEINEDH